MINITIQRKEINFTVQQLKPVSITVGGKPISFTVANRNVTYINSNANYILKIAAVAIGGHRIVCDENGLANYADKDTITHKYKILGITTGAIEQNAEGTIQITGEMIESSWTWIPGQYIFLGNNGLLTQQVPVTGFLLIIGFAETSTKIFIDIKQPINL